MRESIEITPSGILRVSKILDAMFLSFKARKIFKIRDILRTLKIADGIVFCPPTNIKVNIKYLLISIMNMFNGKFDIKSIKNQPYK